MKLSLTYYFLLFIIYSCMGWLLEVACKLRDTKKIINRGFLIGPYCPIYGFGAVAITLLLYRYSYDPLVLFIMTIFTCGALEYGTSYVMEKLFKARWWDYSKRKFNLDGRICLGTIIPFGVFGLILTYITNPKIIQMLNNLNPNLLGIIAIIIAIIITIDYVISTIVIFGFRKTALAVGREDRQDNTEQITKKVREILSDKSWFYKRLIEAFPKLETIKIRIQEITDEVKENAKEIKDNINEKAQGMKNTINDKKEEVKNTITEKTGQVKDTFTETKNNVINKISYQKRKITINFTKSKRKWKKKFIKKQ